MDHKRKYRPIDSMSGIHPPRRKRAPAKQHYLGIEPLPPEPKAPPKAKNDKAISLEINLSKLPKLPYGRILRVTIPILVLIIGIAVSVQYIKKPSRNKASESSQQQIVKFEPLTPPQQTSGEITYDPKTPPPGTSDKIAGVDAKLSQQPLPDEFKADPEASVEKLAKSLHAEKIIYAGEVKAFSGVSAIDGTQKVIFTKKGLLIFINAAKELDKDGLVQYIINLK